MSLPVSAAVPADLELEDRIAGPVTFRMAAWLAVAAAGGAFLTVGQAALIRLPVGLLLLTIGLAGAFVRFNGRPLSAWLLPLCAYRRRARARTSVQSPAGEPPPAEPARQPLAHVQPTTTAGASDARSPGRGRRPARPRQPAQPPVPPASEPGAADPAAGEETSLTAGDVGTARRPRLLPIALALSALAVGGWAGRQAGQLSAADPRPASPAPASEQQQPRPASDPGWPESHDHRHDHNQPLPQEGPFGSYWLPGVPCVC